jgi:hypothetical protein
MQMKGPPQNFLLKATIGKTPNKKNHPNFYATGFRQN